MSKKKMKNQGNQTTIPADASVTPLNLTNPLTDYKKSEAAGEQKLVLPESDVERMRAFDIENKK